jgi:hypothetical protein
MDMDVLVDRQGKAVVTELQTVCGMGNPWEMCVVNDEPAG